MRLTLRIAEDAVALDSLAGPWSALIGRAPGAGLFLAPAWQRAWLAALAGRARPVALAVQDDSGALRAVLPMARLRTRAGGPSLAVAEIGGERLASGDHLGWVCEPGCEGAAWECVEPWLAAELGRADVVRFASMAEGPLAARLREAARRRGWRLRELPREVAPYLDLPTAWNQLETAWGAKRAGRLGYYARRLEREIPDAAYRVNEESRPLGEVLDELTALHTRLWRGRGRAGTLGSPDKRQFLELACGGALRAGQLRLHQLRAGGRLLAGAIVFHFGDTASYYQSGWDPEVARLNAGELVVVRAIRAALEERLACFDFLRGDEPYKRRFASGARALVTLELAARPAGRLALAAGAARGALARAVRGALHSRP